MTYAVQAQLAFRNIARRDAVSANIQTRVGQAGTWGPVERFDYTTPEGDPAVTLTVRFLTRAEQDAFWADTIAFLGTGVNGPVAGSSLWRHDCPHDEGAGACVITERVDF